jgi:23S rRNA (guanine745-N1)-methyltransferase
LLICPLCLGPLRPEKRSLVCPRGHSFDLAREGYVNLLHSNHPGDTREMLASRRRFLDRGHFAPIAQHVCDLAVSHLSGIVPLPNRQFRSVLDAGCGEGYYLGCMQSDLRTRDVIDVRYVGIDSSREACRLAARRYHDICFAVSDLKDLVPVADESVDLLLNVFAPRSVDEFTRVLHPSGVVVVVIPQSIHLVELRSTFPLIGIEENKADHVIRRFEPSLRPAQRESVQFNLVLAHDAVLDLIGMSPSYRHLTEPLPPVSGPMSVTVAVEILTFQKFNAATD